MEEKTHQMILPIKKRTLSLSSSPPMVIPETQCPSNPDFHYSHPTKRLCTGIHRNLGFETQNENIPEYLWDLGNEDRKIVKSNNAQNEFAEYLRGLFDFISADFSNEFNKDENSIRVFGSFVPGKNDGNEKKNKKKRKPWWKSVISRGCDKLRREKMRLRKPFKDLFAPLLNNNREEEEEFEWKIEHKQDRFAFLSLPDDLSTPRRF